MKTGTPPTQSKMAENTINEKTVGALLKRIDPDLAANIVFAGISLSSAKLLDTLQACVIVAEQRALDRAAKKTAAEAEKIVEKAMEDFAEKLSKSGAATTTTTNKDVAK